MVNVPAYASEFGIVEKIVEFFANWKDEGHKFRVEATLLNSGKYDTSVYIRQTFRMSDAMKIEDSKRIDGQSDCQVWVLFPDAPYAHGSTADEAINFQMSLLDDRLKPV